MHKTKIIFKNIIKVKILHYFSLRRNTIRKYEIMLTGGTCGCFSPVSAGASTAQDKIGKNCSENNCRYGKRKKDKGWNIIYKNKL